MGRKHTHTLRVTLVMPCLGMLNMRLCYLSRLYSLCFALCEKMISSKGKHAEWKEIYRHMKGMEEGENIKSHLRSGSTPTKYHEGNKYKLFGPTSIYLGIWLLVLICVLKVIFEAPALYFLPRHFAAMPIWTAISSQNPTR